MMATWLRNLFLIACLVCSAPGWAATVPNITVASTPVTSTYTAVSTFNITVPATLSGSGLFLLVSNEASASTSFVSSVSGGCTWSSVTAVASGLTAEELLYCPGSTAGVTTITVNLASSLTGRYVYGEITGLASASALDVSTNGNTTGTSWTLNTTTGTIAQEVEFVLEGDLTANVGFGGNSNLPSGYTLLAGNGSGTSNKLNFNYKIHAGAVGTESASLTGSSQASSNVTSILATFKAIPNVIQQRAPIATASGTSITVPASRAANFATLLINNSTTGAGTVTQTNATWTKAVSVSGTSSVTELWTSPNLSSSAGTTVTLGTAATSVYTEWYGIATTSPLDQSVTSNVTCSASTTNIVTGTTGSTTQAPELAVAGLGTIYNNVSGSTGTFLNSYLSLAQTTAGGSEIAGIYKILSATGTTSTGGTASPTANTNACNSVLATFKQTNTAATNHYLTLMGTGQ